MKITKVEIIKKMKPMVEPKPEPEPETQPDAGVGISGLYQISENKAYDGSSPEKALILWLHDSTELENGVFEAVRQKAEEYQNANRPVVPPVEEPEETDPTEETTAPAEETDPTEETTAPAEETDPTDETTTPTEESTPDSSAMRSGTQPAIRKF